MPRYPPPQPEESPHFNPEGVQLPHPEGSWRCPRCGNVNWPVRATCNKRFCGEPMPENPEIVA
eukprot:NODE_2756_length_545_cov_190.610887_g2372_i0.p3 GENE.NODE_2756_length_545_cov_190.610887_g2372_i0~~NODE_2756_length_545_cov_190.610887_g2372_i0.p3  ORF type:complete len:63 (-),score=1.70 NODE_2756_length_545_cov_190.610887_g2372_i0:236-424(-)